MKNKLDDLDLNLLRLLCAVVETRNTHTAADKLGISQTSVSRGMAKLRETFGDRLFIRKAHGVEPSELAERLAKAANSMLDPLVKVLESFQDFDPLEFDGCVRIAVHIAALEVHGPDLFEALREDFPQARIELLYWQDRTTLEVLSGEVDAFVQFDGFPLPQEIYLFPVLEYQVCLVAKKHHPVLSRTSEWDSVGNLPVARIVTDGVVTRHQAMDEIYEAKGFQTNVTFSSHCIRAILRKVRTSDAIMYGTTYLRDLDDGVAFYPPPPNMPAAVSRYTLCGGYLQTKRDYPLTQALHQTLLSYFENIETPPLELQD
ncbi:LysR family transcriptional regulator [Agarivorans aestuarii]|uniref:LysR family transcriptional regulator n=1 Tax=Agarivorans aestuarii TaxID=1563703 RepID=UPI001C7F7BC3|nr:LysR family transcriptional regulator [Agarivorans aestuarii]